MIRQLKVIAHAVLALLVVCLMACGGGGGSPKLKLTGTVSDSVQTPVSGAIVYAYDDTNKLITQGTTNIVGRYSFTNLPVNKPLTLKVTGPAGTFPAQAEKVTLAADVATVLDFYLPSFGAATESAPGSNLWQSSAQFHGPRRAVVDLSAAALSATPTAVDVAPFDVSLIGAGYPVYSVSPLAVGVDEIIEYYAAAAFSVSGATFTSANLYLPVPLALDVAAAAAGATTLYRFDETTNMWVAESILPTLTIDPVNSNPAFRATVTQAGYYRVGKPVPATAVTGTLTYSDGTPAAGVTVHVTGSVLPNPLNAYGYQQVLVTNSLGQYTALVKTGGNTTYTFTSWGFGVELNQSSATATATLNYAKPKYNVPAKAALTLDNPSILPNIGADSIGLIVASGRLNSDTKVIDGTTLTPGRADVSFNLNSFDGSLSLNATTKGSGIQLIANNTFARLGNAPTTGYADATTFAAIPIPDVAAFPVEGVLVAVKTSDGYAKIVIDSVTADPLNPDNRVITFRSKFSLSGRF